MSIILIYIVSRVRPAGHPTDRSSCVAKTITLDIARKLFNQFLCIPVMLTDTIDFDHLILLSLTLTLAGGHKVSAKQNLLDSFSHTLLI